MDSDRRGIIALHWEDQPLPGVAIKPQPLAPNRMVSLTELVTFVVYGAPITAAELLELADARGVAVGGLSDAAAQSVYIALSAALLAGELSIWGTECPDAAAERGDGETIEDLLNVRIGGLVRTRQGGLVASRPSSSLNPREIPQEQLMTHWLHRPYSNRLIADPIECYRAGRLMETQWRDVKLLPHHAELILQRLETTAHPGTREKTTKQKPGPAGDAEYIRKYAQIAFPNGVPAGMSKQEARNRIIAEMTKAKSNGDNRRTPASKTFSRHGY